MKLRKRISVAWGGRLLYLKLIKCEKKDMPDNAIWIGERSKYYNQNPWFPNKKLIGITYRQYISIAVMIDRFLLDELKGKNLACNCNDGALCHGNVLLEMMNE